MSKAAGSRADIYTRVTDKIVANLERGVRRWLKPWNPEFVTGRITRPLRATGESYKGVNVPMLWSEAVDRGFGCPIWMTYRQAQELKGQVRKGETGTPVVYADRIRRAGTNEAGEETEREIPFLKSYTVFNSEQIDGLPERFYAKPAPLAQHFERIDAADRFFAATGVALRHGGTRAYYAEGPDYVQMPPFESFRDAESYAATLAHEHVHATKHAQRLAREFGRKRWGDAGYATEELVAELGAAFLCADLGITPDVRDDPAYLASWLEVLKNDVRAIFAAAAHAQRAVDYLHGLQTQGTASTSVDRPEERAA